ncbi:MAG TPA: SDR family NAD(P)-dependent oxidoreductase [Phycisphaerales bacterium]|nr:SDR family NAD(P)-dependent oxidoreductase [Phycisphaerales bacterium]
MAIELAGKPIAITGASSGIGHATAIECAKAGMPVVVGARRLERLNELVKTIESLGGRAIAVQMDVADAAACRGLIDRTVESFGSIYSVFANAGYGLASPIHETSDEQLRAIFETNFFGTLSTVRAALPHMLNAGRGHVLVCSSCLARFTLPYSGFYCATKAAQMHVTRALNDELRLRGIFASSVHPIGTRTELFEEAHKRSPPATADLIDPPGRSFMMQPAETVAKAVVRCLRKPRPEVWTSHATRLGMALAAAFPTMTDAVVRRLTERRLKQAAARAGHSRT